MSFNCPICDKQYPKLISLSLHFRKLHKGTSKKLYAILYHGGVEPLCGCGCGNGVKFLDITRGFRNFIHGHASRAAGKNNWGNNSKARKKSIKTRKKMWEKGELEIWNKGLTKEQHSSIEKYGKAGSKTIKSNADELHRRSKLMQKCRLNGIIPTLYSEQHSQWRGGISPLHAVCRKALYEPWVKPHLIRANFTCEKCNTQNRLEVHHNKETFSSIMRKLAKRHKWTLGLTEAIDFENPKLDNLKKKIAREVADYHVQNNISGLVLCSKCHNEEHSHVSS